MAEDVVVTGGVTVPVGEAGAKPAEKPPEKAAEVKPAEVKVEKPAAKPAKVEVVDGKVRKVRLADDDDAEDSTAEADVFEISPRGLKYRLTRQSNKELDEIYGHHDRAKISADVKELAELRDGREKERKSKLDEMARLKEEREEANARALAAEERAEAIQTEQEVAQAIDGMREVEEGVVDKSSMKFVRGEYKEHLLELAKDDPAEIDKLDASPKAFRAHFKKWIGEFLKENPKHAAGASDDAPKKGLDSGAVISDAETADKTKLEVKSHRPGQSTDAEYKAAMRARGLTP